MLLTNDIIFPEESMILSLPVSIIFDIILLVIVMGGSYIRLIISGGLPEFLGSTNICDVVV